MNAMLWPSRLTEEASVLALVLVRSLPAQTIEEQVRRYKTAIAEPKDREVSTTGAVVAGTPQGPKLVLTNTQTYKFRNAVAACFHNYCEMRGIVRKGRMPRGTIKTFIKDNICVTSKQKHMRSDIIRR